MTSNAAEATPEVVADSCVRLEDVSPSDKPWDTHKAEASAIAEVYADWQPPWTYKGQPVRRPGDKIKGCSTLLGFASMPVDDQGTHKLKLREANFCRCRLCPVCMWRRTLKWVARFLEVLPALLRDHPKTRFIFLTLTVKNCDRDDLRQTVRHLNESWKRLKELKQFPAIGFLKSIEVTVNEQASTAHPHIHALLAVKASYFKGRNYLSQAKWTELWQQSLRADYTPVVNVKTVKPLNVILSEDEIKAYTSQQVSKGADEDSSHKTCVEDIEAFMGLTAALVETVKYVAKPKQFIGESKVGGLEKDLKREWLLGLTEQLYKLKLASVGGIFKQYLSEEKVEDDLIHLNEEGEGELDQDHGTVDFEWNPFIKRYILRQIEQESISLT